MSFIILYTYFFFHEENNFQNKSKADADICMILEQSVTWGRWKQPYLHRRRDWDKDRHPMTSHLPARAKRTAGGQSCGYPDLQTQAEWCPSPSQYHPSVRSRGLDLTSSQKPSLSGINWKKNSCIRGATRHKEIPKLCRPEICFQAQ